MADQKIGAYICGGCGLSERLDISQLESVAKREGKAQVVKSHDFLCSEDGVKAIQNDIDKEGVTHVMVAGCSRRAKTEAFSFDNVAISRANLREGVIWIRPDTDEARETTQEMADDYIRMACAEVKAMTIPQGSGQQSLLKQVLVVGGGISGMTAALEVAKAGYNATIVEKSGQLGGAFTTISKRFPFTAPFADPQDPGIDALAKALEATGKVSVMLNSTVTQTTGSPGRFEAEIATESGTSSKVMAGAIIQATGFKQYDKNLLPEFSPGNTNVVDQFELEQLVKAANGGPITRADGKAINRVVFVQCAGQRSEQEGHLNYCSGHCCSTSIKQAMYFKEANPDSDALILFTDLRTPGAGGEDFYRSGQKKGVTFSKGKASAVTANGDQLTVKFRDLILNDNVEIDADLVVLATGMIPNSGPNPYLAMEMEQAKEDGNQEKVVTLQKQLENVPPSILNLDYRQGTDLPHLVNGFNDSHFICFPYETRRTGIYAAGPVRRPMDSYQAQEDATGAALKAIQALENAALGRAAHPRSGDLSFPQFRKEGCTQCKRCTVECPFGAINEDEARYPVFNESRCRRCGTCMGACPVRVISFENYSVNTVGAALKAVDIPDEFSEKPRILLLACENDAYPALDMAGMQHIEYSAFVRIQPVRCLGSVNTIWISDALNSGYDGIILMGCQKGDNYQCHFVKGSEMAHYRMSKIDDTLKQLNLETERVQTYEIAITDIHKVPKIINDMAETIGKIGMSPFKF